MRNLDRCGLCVIDIKRRKIVVLRRRCPYNNTPNKAIIKSRQGGGKQYHEPFVEQFCIPRGCQQNSCEPSFVCGVREFIEECGFFFKKFYKLPYTFDLEWEDPKDVIWRYKIAFICVDLDSIFVPYDRKINNVVKQIADLSKFEEGMVTLEDSGSGDTVDEENTKSLRVNLCYSIAPVYSKSFKRMQNKEFVQANVMDIDKYFGIINIQKKLYIKTNYSSFLHFIATNALNALYNKEVKLN